VESKNIGISCHYFFIKYRYLSTKRHQNIAQNWKIVTYIIMSDLVALVSDKVYFVTVNIVTALNTLLFSYSLLEFTLSWLLFPVKYNECAAEWLPSPLFLSVLFISHLLGAYEIFHEWDEMFAFLHFAFVIHDTNPLSNIVFLVFITPVVKFHWN